MVVNGGYSWLIVNYCNGDYPLVMTNIAIEHDHKNSGFSH